MLDARVDRAGCKRCSSCVKLKVNLKVGRWVPVQRPLIQAKMFHFTGYGAYKRREVEERRTINRHFSRVSLPTPLKGAYDPELVVY